MTDLFLTKCSAEEVEVAAEVLRGGRLIMDVHVEGFEEELATYLEVGRNQVVTCASGTDALILALRQFVGLGTDVLVPAMTFSATAEAVFAVGARPIPIDVGPDGMLELRAIEEAWSLRTTAVILVHLHGWPAPETRAIADFCSGKGIHLIEDCAQAFGAEIDGTKVGTFGTAAAFSFYPTKPLGGIGDGGAVVFRAPLAATWAAAVRNNGRDRDGRQIIPGCNSRLDEVNAAVLRMRLREYPQTVLKLRGLAKRYDALFSTIAWPTNTLHFEHLGQHPAPYVFPATVQHRNVLREWLASHNIGSGVHYPLSVPQLPYFFGAAFCPNAEWLAKQMISLPCHRGVTYDEVDRICELVRQQQTVTL